MVYYLNGVGQSAKTSRKIWNEIHVLCAFIANAKAVSGEWLSLKIHSIRHLFPCLPRGGIGGRFPQLMHYKTMRFGSCGRLTHSILLIFNILFKHLGRIRLKRWFQLSTKRDATIRYYSQYNNNNNIYLHFLLQFFPYLTSCINGVKVLATCDNRKG